jgi:hypothetical protein
MPQLWLSMGVSVMTDITKYKSVAVDIATYNKLRKLAESNHRYIRQEISRMTGEAYKEKFGDVAALGIGSASKKEA